MAAGLGFKTFATGDVLTANDVNGYLMQGVLVFASAAARNAAITSPEEGQFAYTKDTNGLWYYDGTAWVASGATGDIEGVTAGVGISGGGTSGTVTVTNSMATAIDAKGDLIAGTGADTFARLPVGTNGQVLRANSATATGLEWGVASSDLVWSLKSTTALTGASTITVSSLSSKAYMILTNPTAPASSVFTMRFNGDTGANYGSIGFNYQGDNTYSNGVFNGGGVNTGNTSIRLATKSSDANAFAAGGLTIWAANTTGIKPYQSVFGVNAQGASGARGQIDQGNYSGTSAITSISIISSAGNFTGGNIHIYGAD